MMLPLNVRRGRNAATDRNDRLSARADGQRGDDGCRERRGLQHEIGGC